MTEHLHKHITHYRTQLQQRNQETAQTITTAHTHAVQELQPRLAHIYEDIDAEQQKASDDESRIENTMLWMHEAGKIGALKRAVTSTIDKFASFARMTVAQVQTWAAVIARPAAALFMKTAQPGYTPQSAPLPAYAAISDSIGKLASLFADMGNNAAEGVSKAFHLGLSLGQKAREIATQIVQVLDESRWRSLTIAATEMYKAFTSGLMENYRANSALITGWYWHCKLTSKSCACCVALHGTFHTLDETLQDHPNGECVPAPYFSGMEPPQSGIAWFEQQSEALQREILGSNVAYDLYKSGTPLHAFVGVRHDHGYEPSVYQRSAKQIMERSK